MQLPRKHVPPLFLFTFLSCRVLPFASSFVSWVSPRFYFVFAPCEVRDLNVFGQCLKLPVQEYQYRSPKIKFQDKYKHVLQVETFFLSSICVCNFFLPVIHYNFVKISHTCNCPHTAASIVQTFMEIKPCSFNIAKRQKYVIILRNITWKHALV